MEVRIKEDPQNLNKSVFRGRKGWQYLMIGIAAIIAICVSLFSPFSATVNGILITVFVLPPGYIGVFQRYGMDFFQYYKRKWNKRKVFLYQSEILGTNREKGKKKWTDG